MTKTFPALVTAATLAGAAALSALASCSSSSSSPERPKFTNPVETPPSQDATPRTDEGNKRPSRDKGRQEPSTCVAREPIDATQFPYKPAGVTRGACTEDEARTITTYFGDHANDEDFTIDAWAGQVSASCARCVFSDGSGPTWTPIITRGNDVQAVSRGGCIEVLSGSEACGRAYQQINECSLTACLPKGEGGEASCRNQEEFIGCLAERDEIFDGPCSAAYDAVVEACDDRLGDHERACEGRYTFEGPIRVMCVTGGAPE